MANNIQNLTLNSPKRRELDFYPTPPEATVALIRFLSLQPMHIWEPACGNNAMVDILRQFGHTVTATDISNGNDYLESAPPPGVDAIITNPPFKQSEKFIWKAVKEAKIVCMLLKSQYWHAKGRQRLYETHPPSYILPLTWRPDFAYQDRRNGEKGSPTMDVQWTVWIKGNNLQKYIPLSKPK